MTGRNRRCAAALLIAALIGASCGDDGTSSSAPTAGAPATGSQSTASTTEPGSSPVGAYGAGWSEIGAGIGYLELTADGTGRVLSLGKDLAGPREDRFTYELAGDRLSVTSGRDTAWGCDPTTPGIYRWALVGAVLELAPVDEPCAARAAAIQLTEETDWSWYSLGGAPIVETGPGDAPVAVDTPIGTIEWTATTPTPHTVPESNMSTELMTPPSGGPAERVQVWALDSGYFMRDAGGTCWTSTDRLTWVEATGAPDELAVVATFGDTIYGFAGPEDDYPPTDVTSTDGGRTWEAADRPGDGPGDLFAVGEVGLVAIETAIFGPCVGVVFVSADGATWQRALNPWPPPAMGQPLVGADSIMIPASDCGGLGEQTEWIGTIR